MNPAEGIWSLLKRSMADFAAADLDGLVRIVKRKLKKIQYRPHLIDGCLAATGLKHRALVTTCTTSSTWLAGSLIPNGSADSPWAPGPAGAFLARDPAATPAAQPRRLASASSAAKLLWPAAVISCPVLFACLTTGPPVVCSSGRRRLPFAVPITGTRRLRLAVRGPVEQLGVLATLSRWRSRVQIPSGPLGSPVRFHWGPSQVR